MRELYHLVMLQLYLFSYRVKSKTKSKQELKITIDFLSTRIIRTKQSCSINTTINALFGIVSVNLWIVVKTF